MRCFDTFQLGMEKLQPVSYLLGSVSCWVTDWIIHPNITGMVAYTAPLNAHLPISSGVLTFFLLGWWVDCDVHTMTPWSGSTRRRSMPVRGRLVASQCVPLWVCCSSRGGSNVKIFMGSHGDCPGAIQNPPQKLTLWWFLSKYFFWKWNHRNLMEPLFNDFFVPFASFLFFGCASCSFHFPRWDFQVPLCFSQGVPLGKMISTSAAALPARTFARSNAHLQKTPRAVTRFRRCEDKVGHLCPWNDHSFF